VCPQRHRFVSICINKYRLPEKQHIDSISYNASSMAEIVNRISSIKHWIPSKA